MPISEDTPVLNAHVRFLRRFALVLLALLVAWGSFVYAVDPALYFRPERGGRAVFFSERWQFAGLIRRAEADTLLLGTSMAANYLESDIEAAFGGGRALRVTIPDGYYSEFDQVLELAFRVHPPRRVIWLIDLNTLVRSDAGATGSLPSFLYDETPYNDFRYLLSREGLYYGAYALLGRGAAVPASEAFVTDSKEYWSHIEALEQYERPEVSGTELPRDAFYPDLQENLARLKRWADAYPETEFLFAFSPYSMLFWDKVTRLGEREAMLGALMTAAETLSQIPNARVFGPIVQREVVGNLDLYCDYIHHSAEGARMVLGGIASGATAISAGDLRAWEAFLRDFDFEKYYNPGYWKAWNEIRGITATEEST